jgi:hypothetical protein
VSRVAASTVVPGSPADAEALWFDLARWPAFVDGFATVVRRDPDWPGGGTLVWQSTPHGRGRVFERVSGYTQAAEHASEIEDERLRGTQTITFEEGRRGGTRVTLRLDYAIKDRNLLWPLLDLLFVRRSIRDALTRTMRRFEAERRGDAELA